MGERSGQLRKLLRAGNFAEAEPLLARAAESLSPALDVLHNLAVARYKLGRFEEAGASARAALDAYPDSSRTRYLLALILKDAGHVDEVVDVFSELIESSGDVASPWYHRGTCHFLRGRLSEAASDLERAVALDPRSLAGRYNLGVVHVAAREWDRAREDFAECLRLDPAGAQEYATLLVEIGRAIVSERVYAQGHRLKNMLGIVANRVKSLSSELRSRLSPDERREIDEITSQQGVVFADLAAFLNTLEPAPLELDLADVRDLIDRALFTASPCTGQLKVTKKVADLPELVCDIDAIHEAFLNIILNAAEAMPTGGKLEVAARLADPEHLAVSFRDSGLGMDDETLSRIFQFGFSTKKFGSGLGLSQAREYVRMHGGSIEVESRPGEGSTFTVTLPLSPDIRPGVHELTLRPALFEDLRELMMELPEDKELVIL